MQKLLVFVRSENAKAAKEAEEHPREEGFVSVPKRVMVSCAHSTSKVDGDAILSALEKFAARAFAGEVPILREEVTRGEKYCWWRDDSDNEDVKHRMSIRAPFRLMSDARRFFSKDAEQEKRE